jgi:hypothetical protein
MSKKSILKIFVVVAGPAITCDLYLRAKGVRRDSRRSYHILRDNRFWWPVTGFWWKPTFVLSEHEAREHLKQLLSDNDENHLYRIVSMPLLVKGGLFPTVLGEDTNDCRNHE